MVPPKVKVTILADRGFGDAELFAYLAELGFDFVVRFQERTQVKAATGEAKRASFWVQPSGRTLMLKDVTITEKEMPVAAFVCLRKPRMKGAWCLATRAPIRFPGQ